MIYEIMGVLLVMALLALNFFQLVFALFAINRLGLSRAGYDEAVSEAAYFIKDIRYYLAGFAL